MEIRIQIHTADPLALSVVAQRRDDVPKRQQPVVDVDRLCHRKKIGKKLFTRSSSGCAGMLWAADVGGG